MSKLLLTLPMFLISCGPSSGRYDVVASGESRVTVEMGFIAELNQLCKDLLLPTDYASLALYNQAVAACTFEKMSLININPGDLSSVCTNPATPEQDQLCAQLGY